LLLLPGSISTCGLLLFSEHVKTLSVAMAVIRRRPRYTYAPVARRIIRTSFFLRFFKREVFRFFHVVPTPAMKKKLERFLLSARFLACLTAAMKKVIMKPVKRRLSADKNVVASGRGYVRGDIAPSKSVLVQTGPAGPWVVVGSGEAPVMKDVNGNVVGSAAKRVG